MVALRDGDSRMWDEYVGSQGPREFMDFSPGMTAEEAVEKYLTHLDEMFGPGTADEAPEGLADALERYIEHEIADDEIVVHAGDVMECPNGHTWTAPGDYSRGEWREGGEFDENGRPYLDCNVCHSIMTIEEE